MLYFAATQLPQRWASLQQSNRFNRSFEEQQYQQNQDTSTIKQGVRNRELYFSIPLAHAFKEMLKNIAYWQVWRLWRKSLMSEDELQCTLC